MIQPITHNRQEESSEAKARWFQSLSMHERAELLDAYTDLILEVNPSIMEQKRAQPATGSIRILSKA